MVATAVVSDETKETCQWILECLLSATNLAPNVLFTDADPAMVAAIHESLPTTKHNYCIWHIRKNLDKNLKGKLHGEYSNFVTAWNKCRNSFSENEFKKKFDELLIKFPAASKYLKRSLGTDVTSWALCYTHRSLNAGNQTNQRVESYNSLIKRLVKSSTTLFELDTQIQLLLDKEEQFERQEEQTSENPISGLPNVVRRYFKRVDDIIKKFLTPRLLKMQHRQMNESLLYHADQIEDWENLIGEQEQSEDNEEQSDKERSDNEEQSDEELDNKQSDDEEHRQSDNDDKKINFAEEDYESTISNLYTLVRYLNNATIREVWRVKTIEQNKEHFVVICDNANHLYTCMLLVTKGLVCRHFFTVMNNSETAMFHIGLISDRWYNKKALNYQKEPAVTICKKRATNCVDPVYEHQIAPDFDLLYDIRHTQAFSENAKQNLSHQAKYNQGFGYAKRVIGISLDMGCEDELNGILQSWIKEKEKERQSETLTCNSNKENLSNVSNPHRTRTKGAPRKRIKNVLEENQSQKKSSGRYNCSYCKSSGHNARRCELKKNLKKNLNLNDYLVILLLIPIVSIVNNIINLL